MTFNQSHNYYYSNTFPLGVFIDAYELQNTWALFLFSFILF